MDEPKWRRKRHAKAELWVLLAMHAESYAQQLQGCEAGIAPPEQWPADDPFRTLWEKYGLTPAELGKLLGDIADQMEIRAMQAGYDDIPMV